ncbi:MAG: DUF1566 domain-containing protein [Maribacter arcticus]|uniref:Lcl C-terminal domain-containing protein n=1 Tax=Maribacter arcticus TaxID=561365 RepID=UPI0030018A84
MKKLIILFVGILMLASCSIDEVVVEEAALITNEAVQNKGLSAKTGFEVAVCHKGKYKIIQNEDSLNDHIAHRDAVDMDGDGFFDKECPCSDEVDEDDSVFFTFSIGQSLKGGIVFYIADTPTDLNGDGVLNNVLVCAIEDQGITEWGYSSPLKEAGTGETIGTGSANTDAIIKSIKSQETYAAGLARGYKGGGYNDWFLPSKDELDEMHKNKEDINTTATDNGGTDFVNVSYTRYWSSTEYSVFPAGNAWTQFFASSSDAAGSYKGEELNVRAVRAF